MRFFFCWARDLARELEELRREVLEHSREVHGGGGSRALRVAWFRECRRGTLRPIMASSCLWAEISSPSELVGIQKDRLQGFGDPDTR